MDMPGVLLLVEDRTEYEVCLEVCMVAVGCETQTHCEDENEAWQAETAAHRNKSGGERRLF